MLHKGPSSFSRLLILGAAIMVLASAAFAQLTTTGIHGIVRDPSGAVVPKADVKLTDTGTGLEKSTTSGADGGFVFIDLEAATYKIAVSAPGFQTAAHNN